MDFIILSEEESKKVFLQTNEKEEIIKVLQYDEVSILKNFIKERNFDKKRFLHKNPISEKYYDAIEPDILIYSIKNNNSFEVIQYIISLYPSLNYFELLSDCNIEQNFYLTPFLSSVIHKRYDIADLILENGFEFMDKIKLDILGIKTITIFDFLNKNGYLDEESLNYTSQKCFIFIKNYNFNNISLFINSLKDNYVKLFFTNALNNNVVFKGLYSYLKKEILMNNNNFIEKILKYYFGKQKDNINYYDDELIETAIECKNYKAIELFIEYHNNKVDEKRYIGHILELLNKNASEDRAKLFIDSITNHDLKNQVQDILLKNKNITQKRSDVIKLLKNDNLSELKKYVEENNINLRDLHSEDFDSLTLAVLYQTSIEMIEFIFSHCKYENIKYYCSVQIPEEDEFDIKYAFDFCHDIITYSIAQNNFKTADFLMEKNNDPWIIFEETIETLSYYGFLNINNLKYTICTDHIHNKKIPSTTIKSWIKHKQNSFLEVFLKYYGYHNKNDANINDRYYIKALFNKNYDAIMILYDNDNRKKKIILYKLIQFFDYVDMCNNEHSNEKHFLNYLNKNQYRFKDLNLYCNDKLYHDDDSSDDNGKEDNEYDNMDIEMTFINEEKYKKLKQDMKNNYLTIKKLLKRREKLENLLYHSTSFYGHNDKFITYIEKYKVPMNKMNTYNYDLLIWAIEEGASNENIIYIIDHGGYKTFNYYIEYENNKNYRYKMKFYQTPLLAAIKKKNFKISHLLLEKGANINFDVPSMLPWYIYKFSSFDSESLNYILNKGYYHTEYLIKYCIRDPFCSSRNNFIKTIADHSVFDNDFIIYMLSLYKKKEKISQKDFQKLLFNEKRKLFNHKIIDFAMKYCIKRDDGEEILNSILYYIDDEKIKSETLLNYTINKLHLSKMSFGWSYRTSQYDHNYCIVNNVDENDEYSSEPGSESNDHYSSNYFNDSNEYSYLYDDEY